MNEFLTRARSIRPSKGRVCAFVLAGTLFLVGAGCHHSSVSSETLSAPANVFEELGFVGDDPSAALATFLGSELASLAVDDFSEYLLERQKPWTILRTLRIALLLYRCTGETSYLDWFCKAADVVVAHRADRTETADYRGEALKTWVWIPTFDTGWEGNKNVALAVWTAAVALPLTEFALLVQEEAALGEHYEEKAQEYVAVSREAMAVHDREWVWGPDAGEGHYTFPYDSPMRFDGLPMPHNEQSLAGTVLLNLWKLTGHTRSLEMAQAMALLFANRLERKPPDGEATWSYWYGIVYEGFGYNVSLSTNSPELAPRQNTTDMGHASWMTDFVMNMYSAGLVFEEDDIVGIRKTLDSLMSEASKSLRGYPHFRLDGSDNRPGFREALVGTGWIRIAEEDHALLQLLFEHSLRTIARYASRDESSVQEQELRSATFLTRAGISLAYLAALTPEAIEMPAWTIIDVLVDMDDRTLILPIEGPGSFYIYFPTSVTQSDLRGDVTYSILDKTGQLVHSEIDESLWAKDLCKYHYVTSTWADKGTTVHMEFDYESFPCDTVRVLWIVEED